MKTTADSKLVPETKKSIQFLTTTALLILILVIKTVPASAVELSSCDVTSFPQKTPEDTWRIFSIPAGHGDAHLVVPPDNTATLIDAGSTTTFSNVETVLDGLKIETIDRLILTHPHWDHAGGLKLLDDNYDIKKLYRPELDPQSDLSKPVRKLLQAPPFAHRKVRRGDTIPIPGRATARVLHPPQDASGSSLNRESLVFQLQAPGLNSLWMADVTSPIERELLNRDLISEADILKVGHHGNAAGTSDTFLKKVKPEIAVVPAPLRSEDPWGRPDKQLLTRLNSREILTLHTGKTGLINLRWDGSGINKIHVGKPELCF